MRALATAVALALTLTAVAAAPYPSYAYAREADAPDPSFEPSPEPRVDAIDDVAPSFDPVEAPVAAGDVVLPAGDDVDIVAGGTSPRPYADSESADDMSLEPHVVIFMSPEPQAAPLPSALPSPSYLPAVTEAVLTKPTTEPAGAELNAFKPPAATSTEAPANAPSISLEPHSTPSTTPLPLPSVLIFVTPTPTPTPSENSSAVVPAAEPGETVAGPSPSPVGPDGSLFEFSLHIETAPGETVDTSIDEDVRALAATETSTSMEDWKLIGVSPASASDRESALNLIVRQSTEKKESPTLWRAEYRGDLGKANPEKRASTFKVFVMDGSMTKALNEKLTKADVVTVSLAAEPRRIGTSAEDGGQSANASGSSGGGGGTSGAAKEENSEPEKKSKVNKSVIIRATAGVSIFAALVILGAIGLVQRQRRINEEASRDYEAPSAVLSHAVSYASGTNSSWSSEFRSGATVELRPRQVLRNQSHILDWQMDQSAMSMEELAAAAAIGGNRRYDDLAYSPTLSEHSLSETEASTVDAVTDAGSVSNSDESNSRRSSGLP